MMYKFWLPLACLLVVLSYGDVGSRGGYGDDFVLLEYSVSREYVDAVLQWPSRFNSRLGQAVTGTFLYQIFSGDGAADYHWWGFHLLALISLAVILIAMNGVLEVVGVPTIGRIAAVLLIALHPAKNQALMWPATIFGYMLPMAGLLTATWFYYRCARSGRESPIGLLTVAVIALWTMLSLEQFVPLVILVVFFRLMIWRPERWRLLSHLAGLAVLLGVFVASVLAGGTSGRMARFAFNGAADVVQHAGTTLFGAGRYLLVEPFRPLLDPDYTQDVLGVVASPWFAAVLLLVGLAAWKLMKLPAEDVVSNRKIRQLLFVAGAGALVIMSGLLPMLAVKYYLPERAIAIPLVGFALTVAAGFLFLWHLAPARVWRGVLAVGLAVVLVAYTVADFWTQRAYAQYWHTQKILIEAVEADTATMAPRETIALFNFPRSYTGVPSLINDFSFPALVRWTSGKDIVGNALGDLFDILQVSPESAGVLIPPAGVHLLWYATEGPEAISGLRPAVTEQPLPTTGGNHDDDRSASGMIGYRRYAVDIETRYPNGARLQVAELYRIPSLDSAALRVHLSAPGVTRQRLTVHAVEQSSVPRLFDRWLDDKDADGEMNATVLVNGISEVTEIRVGLEGVASQPAHWDAKGEGDVFPLRIQLQ